MTTVRTRRLICISIKALAFLLPLASQAGDPPAAIPDSTPSGMREPFCPSFLGALRAELTHALGHTTGKKFDDSPAARNALERQSQDVRDSILKKIKVHFYNSQPIEILDSAIGLKSTYVVLDKAGAIPAAKVDRALGDQLANDIEWTIKAAETYPARRKELIQVDAQAQMRLKRLTEKLDAVKENRIQQNQWLKAVKAETYKLNEIPAGQTVELELPILDEYGQFYNAEGKLHVASHRVKFNSVAEARKAIADTEEKLRNGIKFDGPYWIKFPAVINASDEEILNGLAVQGSKVADHPHEYSYGSTADLEVAIKNFRRLFDTLGGGYKTEGSFLNTDAGQVVNLKEVETIRNIFRTARMNLENSERPVTDEAKKYFDDQIARIDKIIDPMNRPKAGFSPPEIAFEKVKTGQFFNELKLVPKSIKDNINKPIRSRKQWDNMGTGVLNGTSNGDLHQPGLKVGNFDTPPPAPEPQPKDPAPQGPIAQNPFPNNPGWSNDPIWFGGDIGTAGPISNPMSSSVFSWFKPRSTPLTNRYDTLMGKLGAIDPAILEAYGLSKPGTALALWRGSKAVAYAGITSTLIGGAYKATPQDWIDSALTAMDHTDKMQIKLCATQGARQVGDAYVVPSDPNQNSASDQAFLDCSIAAIKTKFVKDYLAELSKDASVTKPNSDSDSIEVDPNKITAKQIHRNFFKDTKEDFFKNPKTGEIYVRPDLTSVGFAQQPGIAFDPKFQMMKINIDQIPVEASTGPQHIVEKNPKSGALIFHIDRLATSDSGLYSLNDKHEIVLSPKINDYVEKLLEQRRKVMGYRNRQSNIESVLRQFMSSVNPCSDPGLTRWLTSKSKDEYKKGLLACLTYSYPGFMHLGDTEARVNELLDADVKQQPDLLKPLIGMDATFGNYLCTLVSQRYTYTDPAAQNLVVSPFNCQNIGDLGGLGNGWGLPGVALPWGNGIPGAWNPGGGWSAVPLPAGNGAAPAPAPVLDPAPAAPAAPQAPKAPEAKGNTAPGVPNYIPGLSGPPTPNMHP
jgi:hypothetical protein